MSREEHLEMLQTVAEAALPDRPVRAVDELHSDGPAVVGQVRTGRGARFVVKCAPGPGGPSRLRKEAAVTNVVDRETPVPVPGILAADVEPPAGTPPYLLFRWADGRALSEAVETTPPFVHGQLFHNLGATLANLHDALSFDVPGQIVADGLDAFDVQPAESWPVLFAEELADHVEALGGTRFEALAEDVWNEGADRLSGLEMGAEPVLLHGDIGDGNVIYDGVTPASLLDWERAFVGHPEYDLCRAELRYFWNQWGEPDRLQSAFYEGYRSQRRLTDGFDTRRPVYLATFYLLSLSTYEEWGPRYTTDLDGLATKVAEKVRGLLNQSNPVGQ